MTTTALPNTRSAQARWLLLWGILATCALAPELVYLVYRIAGQRAPIAVTAIVECGGVLAAAAVTVWLRQARTLRGWRDPVCIAAVTIAIAHANLIGDLSGATDVTVLRLLLTPAVLALLAIELVRHAGGEDLRPARPTWRTVNSAVAPALLYGIAMFLASAVAVVLAQFGALDQVADLGLNTTPTGVLIVRVVSDAVVQEVVMAGGLWALGLALRVPAPAMIAAGVAARLVVQLYMGPPALAAAIVGAAAVGIFLHQRRVLPLIAAHALYNGLAIYAALH
ncbi:hypothetical protein [Kitasatospora cheerisanensis]|nr:hypothetical protein [Kitasatospora cheerisanensis]